MEVDILRRLPSAVPKPPSRRLRYADVAVTATAKEFAGVYRGKQQHEPDFDAVINRALASGCERIMLTGMSLADVDFNLRIVESRPGSIYMTVGIHPYHVSEIEKDPDNMTKLKAKVQELVKLNPSPIAAFGELGLDYDHLEWADKDMQRSSFRKQLDVAVECDLPLFLHCRAAFDDFVAIIKPYLARLSRAGLVHSFVGSTKQMEALVDMGFDISVNGFSFKTEESVKMVAAIPLARLQIETDAPWGIIPANNEVSTRYLVHAPPAPVSKKRDKFQVGCMVKERNESCMIDRVAYVVAGLKGIPVEHVAEAAWENSIRMFKL